MRLPLDTRSSAAARSAGSQRNSTYGRTPAAQASRRGKMRQMHRHGSRLRLQLSGEEEGTAVSCGRPGREDHATYSFACGYAERARSASG